MEGDTTAGSYGVAQPLLKDVGQPLQGLRLVAGTGEDGKARVFGEAGIGLGELAKEELRAFGGLDETAMNAVRTQPESGVLWPRRALIIHRKLPDTGYRFGEAEAAGAAAGAGGALGSAN